MASRRYDHPNVSPLPAGAARRRVGVTTLSNAQARRRRGVTTFSNAQARRISLAAQGFAGPRPSGRVDRRHLHRVLDQIGLIQIDSVNVVARSQELVLFARLGPHPRTLIDDATASR